LILTPKRELLKLVRRILTGNAAEFSIYQRLKKFNRQ